MLIGHRTTFQKINVTNNHYDDIDLMEVIGGVLHQKPMDRECRKRDIPKYVEVKKYETQI